MLMWLGNVLGLCKWTVTSPGCNGYSKKKGGENRRVTNVHGSCVDSPLIFLWYRLSLTYSMTIHSNLNQDNGAMPTLLLLTTSSQTVSRLFQYFWKHHILNAVLEIIIDLSFFFFFTEPLLACMISWSPLVRLVTQLMLTFIPWF